MIGAGEKEYSRGERKGEVKTIRTGKLPDSKMSLGEHNPSHGP